jgi:hypothetical protein
LGTARGPRWSMKSNRRPKLSMSKSNKESSSPPASTNPHALKALQMLRTKREEVETPLGFVKASRSLQKHSETVRRRDHRENWIFQNSVQIVRQPLLQSPLQNPSNLAGRKRSNASPK